MRFSMRVDSEKGHQACRYPSLKVKLQSQWASATGVTLGKLYRLNQGCPSSRLCISKAGRTFVERLLAFTPPQTCTGGVMDLSEHPVPISRYSDQGAAV